MFLIAIAGMCLSEVAGAHGGFCARYGGDEFVCHVREYLKGSC